jgi:FkbM family methyltransferase
MKKFLKAIYKKLTKLLLGTEIRRFKLIKKIDNIITSYIKSDFVIIQGHKMFLDSKDSLRLSFSEYFEPFETELVKNEIKNGYRILDIGANIGYYTLIIADLIGKNGLVYAFEPEPKNFKLLEKNIQINNLKNVVLYNKAASNFNGYIDFYINKTTEGGHSIYKSANSEDRPIQVEAIKLDDCITDKIDFVKIDVEGAEGEVLLGMQNILKNNQKIKLIIEFHPRSLNKSSFNANQYLDLLVMLGFKLYNVNERNKKLEPTSKNELLSQYTVKNNKMTNIFCVK